MLFWGLVLVSDPVPLSVICQDLPCLSAWPRYSVVSLGFPISTGISAKSLGLLSILPHPCCLSWSTLGLPFPSLATKGVFCPGSCSVFYVWLVTAFKTSCSSSSQEYFVIIRFFHDTCKKLLHHLLICFLRMEQLYCMWGQANARREEEGRNSYKGIKPCICSAVGKGRG